MAELPLRGVRVLDLSRVLAGPYCTLMLADLGADVIKVEPPQGDETRRFGPPFVGDESTYFLSINRNKRSIAVDLKTAEGRGVVHDLARWADIAVHNFRPGDAPKLGVDADTLMGLNPRLIYVSISGYGSRGTAPYTRLPGYDLVIQGVGGLASLTGPPGEDPYKVGTSIADLVAGLNAFGAAMAALYQRQQSGCGSLVDMSMLDGQLALLTYHASSYLHTGEVPQRLGNAHPSICPYETFRAADGHFNVACGNDRQFIALSQALEAPEMATDARYATNPLRVRHREPLVAALAAIVRRRPVAHWLGRIGAAGVPCGPICDVPGALQHPQAVARGMLMTQDHPTAGATRSVATAAAVALGGAASVRPPPRLSEHALEILTDILLRTPAQIRALVATGAVLKPADGQTGGPSPGSASPVGAPAGAGAGRG